ncbi:MAG: cysteine hydrolase [Bacteroidales bacterium]|nr:cysteine hydrolase [Bacteroidales bacterium]
MKKLSIFISCLLLIILSCSFAQEATGQDNKVVKPALLVIDIQNAYLDMIPAQDKEIGLYLINALIEVFRSNGFPIIRVYHYSEEYGPKQDTEEFEFPSSVKIEPGDPKIVKTYPDGFNKTELDRILRETGSNTVFLTGLSAVGCVLATWIGAHNHDYTAFMVKDAIMSHNSGFTDQAENMFDAVSYEVVKLMVNSASN